MREKIVDDWLQDKKPTEIGKEVKLDKQTVSSIVDNFVRKDTLRQEREEIKYATHELMMLSTAQSTASKH